MAQSEGIRWTNRSVLSLAGHDDPVVTIEKMARDLVLRALDAGWKGPPYNPIAIADILGIPVEATASVSDARTVPFGHGLRIQFNPTQARERVRFSIAHELAHTLFPDVAEEPRHRGGTKSVPDEWQLEMLCNLAAAEFVMPTGSLKARDSVPPIEQLMVERRTFDVSAEAFLIRVTKIASDPVLMFCASPILDNLGKRSYRIDYSVASKSSPRFPIVGRMVPEDSVVFSCTAIGYTDTSIETWFGETSLKIECVGIPGYPGSNYPRVAGIIRFSPEEAKDEAIRFIHGDIFQLRGTGQRILCQLVNDQARVWGGGVASVSAKKYPIAQREFSSWIIAIPRDKRLGQVHFAKVSDTVTIASLIGQEGYGPSEKPRVRYTALEQCLQRVSELATEMSASVHMPRIGTGQAGGSWDTVEEIIQDTLLVEGVSVTVYDLPPKRISSSSDLFD